MNTSLSALDAFEKKQSMSLLFLELSSSLLALVVVVVVDVVVVVVVVVVASAAAPYAVLFCLRYRNH